MEEGAWLFELAALLGRTVGELIEEMPMSELTAWRQWIMEPRGDRRGDWHAAMISKAIHDVGMGFAGRPNDQALDRYLLKFQPDSPQEVLRRNLAAARALFGKVVPC